MYFLRARYMEPGRGRFSSMDEWEGQNIVPLSLHKYLYVLASPITYRDPSGHEATLVEIEADTAIDNIIEGNAERGIYYISKKAGCYAIEYAVGELITFAVQEGLYLLLDSGGLPYVGRSVSVERRLGEHLVDEKIASRTENVLAKFNFVGEEGDLRRFEQWMIDDLKKWAQLGANDSLGGNGLIGNQRNEFNRTAREEMDELNICK